MLALQRRCAHSHKYVMKGLTESWDPIWPRASSPHPHPPSLSWSFPLALSFPLSFQLSKRRGAATQGKALMNKLEEKKEKISESVTEIRVKMIRSRESWSSDVDSLLLQPDAHAHPDPWHKYDTPAATLLQKTSTYITPPSSRKLQHYHMYGSPSPLIMLITCSP